MTAIGPPAVSGQPTAPSANHPPVEHRYWVRCQVLSIIEVPLLLLLAYLFAYQTGAPYTIPSSDQFGGSTSIFGPDPPIYLSAFLWIATVAAVAAAVIIGLAFRQTRIARLRLLILGNMVAALAAGAGVLGDLFLRSVWTWTTTDGSQGPTISPTPNGVIAEVILAAGVAIAASVLPLAIGLLLRRHGPAAATHI